ncbi:orotidine-5'-phosphate decarboxylase [bacterium]|nr:MAG: orotidine-5'-phosphate decarboxylase [bacterium]
MKPEIIVALDVDSLKEAKQLINLLYPKIKLFKVGIHLFTAAGTRIIDFINQKGAQVFLDLKFFDIPNTVAHAVRRAVYLKVKMLTLHIMGNEEMLKQAVKMARLESRRLKIKKPLLIGVTILTSKKTNPQNVLILAKKGIACGLDGVVCSVRELPLLRSRIKKRFYAVTPGIRPNIISGDDQKRTATVAEAIKAGSDFIVVGRPVLKAKDPLLAAQEIIAQIKKVSG